MEGEYFYGAVLGEAGASTTWNSSDSGHDEGPGPVFKLVVRQILLGPTAKADEYNVVEVETTSANGVVKLPIAVLKVGEARTSTVNLEFPESPVTFKLIEGAGPVYIHGNIISAYMEQVEEVEDECMELVEEEQEDEMKPENKKRKMGENGSKAPANGSSNNSKTSKKQKSG